MLINVPHPRHDYFLSDPTHVRAITPDMLRLFDREHNDRAEESGWANTPLAHYTGVDFKLVGYETVLDEPYWSQLRRGEIGREEVARLLRSANNVAREYRFVLEVRKAG